MNISGRTVDFPFEVFEMEKTPHLLVWAKQKTYPYWPAKLMSVNAEQNTVNVRYFDVNHTRAVLPPNDCYMYSEDCPTTKLGKYKQSMKEAKKVRNFNDIHSISSISNLFSILLIGGSILH